MDNIVFYRDKSQQFTCNLTVEGAEVGNTQARVVLEVGDRHYLFKGSIDSNGDVLINIPPLTFIKENFGKAHLEVIADSTFFEPYIGEIEIKVAKKVTAESIKIVTDDSDKVTIEESTPTQKKVAKKKRPVKKDDKARLVIRNIFNELTNKG